ncbi:MAG: preprotein translocase subunit SecG [Paludibacteraceae bacterium]|jgi:preprotein translocase subunit SecG|nr:preprotein translocase subunit SecG [Paludibacteraceae bacterium]
MFTVLVVLAVVVGILLILLVISQKSKGGGLASGFASSNQVLGVRKTTDFVEKATWSLVAIMVVLCVAAVGFSGSDKEVAQGSALQNKIMETAAPVESPVAPVAAPAEAPAEVPAAPAE